MLRITVEEAEEVLRRWLEYDQGETSGDDFAFVINEWLERKEKEATHGKVPD